MSRKTSTSGEGHPRTSSWGRSIVGGGTAFLIIASILIGLALSSGIGWLFVHFSRPESPWLAFAVMVIMTAPISVILGWALLVDRRTLTGVYDNPDQSIESAWFDKAAARAFGDVIAVVGLGAGITAITRIDIDGSIVLLGVAILALLDFAARYQVIKRAES